MEFPSDKLLALARRLDLAEATTLRLAVGAYHQLADRCVMDRTAYSLEVAELREKIRLLESTERSI